MSWNAHALASGSRDRLILMRDVRVQEPFTDKLVGHKQEVGEEVYVVSHISHRGRRVFPCLNLLLVPLGEAAEWLVLSNTQPILTRLIYSLASPVLSTCYNHFIPIVGVGKRGAY